MFFENRKLNPKKDENGKVRQFRRFKLAFTVMISYILMHSNYLMMQVPLG